MFVTLACSTLYICVEHTLAHIFKQKLINHHIWNIWEYFQTKHSVIWYKTVIPCMFLSNRHEQQHILFLTQFVWRQLLFPLMSAIYSVHSLLSDQYSWVQWELRCSPPPTAKLFINLHFSRGQSSGWLLLQFKYLKSWLHIFFIYFKLFIKVC